MRNLLIIIPNLNSTGGTERAAINLANLLCSDYKVSILSLSEYINGPFYRVDSRVDITYRSIGESTGNYFQKLIWFYKCFRIIGNFTKDKNVNIVISLTHNINVILSLLNRRKLVLIGCEHVSYDSIPKVSRLIVSRTYPKLHALVVLSEGAKQSMSHINKNIIIIPNSLPFNSTVMSNLTNTRIIMVGRLSIEKGYERVISIAKHIMKFYPNWSIEIFGDGDLREELNGLISKEELQNVKLSLPVTNIQEEYISSSILLSTSYTEAFPMVFLEAMNCGLPVISFKNQGSDSLINHNTNGLIVESDIDLIKNLSNLIESRELRKRLGEQGRIDSLLFSSKNIKSKWLNLLKEL